MLGLILICWTLYTSYSIFIGRGEAPEIFSASEEETPISPEGMPEEGVSEEQLMQALAVDRTFLPEIANLLVWGFLAFILIFGGSQIAGLGIKLMK